MRYKVIVKKRVTLESLTERAFSGMDKPLCILVAIFAGYILGRIIVSLVLHR